MSNDESIPLSFLSSLALSFVGRKYGGLEIYSREKRRVHIRLALKRHVLGVTFSSSEKNLSGRFRYTYTSTYRRFSLPHVRPRTVCTLFFRARRRVANSGSSPREYLFAYNFSVACTSEIVFQRAKRITESRIRSSVSPRVYTSNTLLAGMYVEFQGHFLLLSALSRYSELETSALPSSRK